jgi:hypothetical protein
MTDLQTRTHAALDILSNEYGTLTAQQRATVVQDCVAAYLEDGCDPGQYLARIGTGNLASYVRCLS